MNWSWRKALGVEQIVAVEPDEAADVPIGGRGDSLSALVAAFKSEFPEEWDANSRCPLEYGLALMIEKLNG